MLGSQPKYLELYTTTYNLPKYHHTSLHLTERNCLPYTDNSRMFLRSFIVAFAFTKKHPASIMQSSNPPF